MTHFGPVFVDGDDLRPAMPAPVAFHDHTSLRWALHGDAVGLAGGCLASRTHVRGRRSHGNEMYLTATAAAIPPFGYGRHTP
jgi:hypothetical protein